MGIIANAQAFLVDRDGHRNTGKFSGSSAIVIDEFARLKLDENVPAPQMVRSKRFEQPEEELRPPPSGNCYCPLHVKPSVRCLLSSVEAIRSEQKALHLAQVFWRTDG